MMYMMADNEMEPYLLQNYEDLTSSLPIQDPNLRLWVSYDAFNGSPLPNTVDQNGNPLTSSFTGTRYMTYRDGSMVVDFEFAEEQNSDTREQIQSFLEYSLTDCLASGHESLMAVFSSHGGGFAGFGGDANTRRHLLQNNAGVASAIKDALATVGWPGKLEVLGFDANSLQAVGAADDYMDVADYILASESVVPGDGKL